jgi:2'-5' RNA ligase
MTILEKSQAKENKSGKYSMVAIYCPQRLGVHLLDKFKDVPGDALLPQDFHITIGLVQNHQEPGIPEEIKRGLIKATKNIKRFPIKIEEFGVFEPHESNKFKYVLHAKPKADEFKYLHSEVFEELKKRGVKIDNGSHDFSPHITIKYCRERPPLDNYDVDVSFIANKIAFAIGSNKWETKIG